MLLYRVYIGFKKLIHFRSLGQENGSVLVALIGIFCFGEKAMSLYFICLFIFLYFVILYFMYATLRHPVDARRQCINSLNRPSSEHTVCDEN